VPQVDGPKHLNEILESAYSSARGQSHSKESASKIAWASAKEKYKKNAQGDWVRKFFSDLGILVLALNKVVSKTDAKDYEYFLYPLEQFAKEIKAEDDQSPIVWLNIDDVMLNSEHNPIDQSLVEDIKNGIKESKEVRPLVYVLIDNDGIDVPMIADGYHRYLALKALGYKLIPTRLADERGTKTTERDKPVKLMTEEDTKKFEKRDDRVEWLPTDEFFLNPYHTPANRSIVDDKKSKIKETGRVKPLLYSEIDNSGKIDKIIVDGYHRFIALKELGYDHVPVIQIDENGVRASDGLDRVKLNKEMSSVDVEGLGLVRQDLQGKPKKPNKHLEDGMAIGKGGPGSGRHPENPEGRADNIDEQIAGHKADLKSGKIKLNTFKQRVEPLYALKQRTGSFSGQTVKPIISPSGINKGGPGSGCQGPNCGRPASGNKAFDEPFHSGSHVKQFLGENNVVLGSVDRSELSPEKNTLRQQEFESQLQSKGIPYKKSQGVSSQWGNENSYIIHAPEQKDADQLQDTLTRKYKQDAVIHVRNGHAIMVNHKENTISHANVGKLEAGDQLTDNYTQVDGQKFRLNFR
jgi:hypothetical protein